MVRVGGERAVRVNVRIVAATHRDLPAMVESQTFREDLYYRLAVFPIVIPPLRDRPGDIRAFAEYFAERAANRFGVRPVPVSESDVRLLTGYRWPGNVREMAAVMDRAVLHRPGSDAQRGRRARQRRHPAAPITRPGPGPDPVVRPRAARRRHPAPHRAGAAKPPRGRVEGPHGAARLLRINPHTLRARMRKLRVDWRSFRISAAQLRAGE